MRDLSCLVAHLPYSTDGYASFSVPTHRASTIVFRTAEEYAKRGARGPDGYVYGLHGTPTARALQARLTALEGGQRTALLPSGQASIATVFLTVTAPGDRILIPDTVYPPVRDLAANFLAPRGIECEIYDPELAAESIADRIDRRTRLVWLESPGSTTLEVQDVMAITNAAHAKGALVGCDNTWATPLLFKPLSHGVDFSMQALTKYAGGHADFLMGSVSVSDMQLYYRLKATMRMLGIGVSPDDCFLALRGLETMGVRLAHCSRVALDLASQLARSPAVERVLHPALSDSPGYAIWKRDFAGSSGVFSAVLRRDVQPTAVAEALAAMRFFSIGASWGGTHSLLVPMEIAKDRTVKRWDPGTTILRLSIGMEDPEDLREDLHAVIERLERDLSSPG